MKNIITVLTVCLLLLAAGNHTYAKTETNVNIDYVSSAELAIVLGVPATNTLTGFTLSCDFIFDNRDSGYRQFISLGFGSAAAAGGYSSSSIDFISGYGISKNVFLTFEYLTTTSANIRLDGLLAGAKISQSYLNDRLYLESYYSSSLLGFSSMGGAPLPGNTSISKLGVILGYRVSDNFIINCEGKIADMAYFDTTGAINLKNISLSLGVTLPF